jgi:hypothetical protein
MFFFIELIFENIKYHGGREDNIFNGLESERDVRG